METNFRGRKKNRKIVIRTNLFHFPRDFFFNGEKAKIRSRENWSLKVHSQVKSLNLKMKLKLIEVNFFKPQILNFEFFTSQKVWEDQYEVEMKKYNERIVVKLPLSKSTATKIDWNTESATGLCIKV